VESEEALPPESWREGVERHLIVSGVAVLAVTLFAISAQALR